MVTMQTAESSSKSAGLSPRLHALGRIERPSLLWTPEVERATASIYERVRDVIPPVEWPFHAPYIKAINELKREREHLLTRITALEEESQSLAGLTEQVEMRLDGAIAEIRAVLGRG